MTMMKKVLEARGSVLEPWEVCFLRLKKELKKEGDIDGKSGKLEDISK